MKTILFACVHNAGRSQMAAAWFNKLTDPARAIAVSAGTIPESKVHAEVVEVMREVGIDLTHQQPQLLTDSLARNASLLITMGCGEACPVVPGLRREDWPLQDPKGQDVARVRALRDEIEARVRALLRRETR
jgi:arsenate reductase